MFQPAKHEAGSFAACFVMPGESDHAAVTATFKCRAGKLLYGKLEAESLIVSRPGLGREVAKQPSSKENCAKHQRAHECCGKDYEKARMPPGFGAVLFRLYARRNCHHVSTHPLKAMGLAANVTWMIRLR